MFSNISNNLHNPARHLSRHLPAALLALGSSFAWAAIPPGPLSTTNGSPSLRANIDRAYSKLPLRFEPNYGQFNSAIKFSARGKNIAVALTTHEAVLSLRSEGPQTNLRMRLVGGNPKSRISGRDPLPGTSNYLLGNNPSKWHSKVPGYSSVLCHDVYPGIDLAYYGNDGGLEYDFVVRPGANPGAIRLAFSGQDHIEVGKNGDLRLSTKSGNVTHRLPVMYQENNGKRKQIAGRYVLCGKDQVAFEVSRYDPRRELVVDPVISFSSFLGGNGADNSNDITIDAVGNIYITGETNSSNFPTANAFQSDFKGGLFDCFVTKLTPDASSIVYSTYLGGSDNDEGHGIAVNLLGEAYIVGMTRSSSFPTMNPIQAEYRGEFEAFVAKLRSDGAGLVFSTFLGGSSADVANRVAVDVAGNAFVVGQTRSPEFPTVGALQPKFAGGVYDVFITKLSGNGERLLYSTFLGGSDEEYGLDIAVDLAGSAYVTGGTESPDFPVANPFQRKLANLSDAFAAKLSPDGASLVFSTFLGGRDNEYGFGIGVDLWQNVYVAGRTASADFPLANAIQSTAKGFDAFVTKLRSDGATLAYSTFLGGGNVDEARDIAVDFLGNAYVVGQTRSVDFPVANAVQSQFGGGITDAFAAKLPPDGSVLEFSTFLGGNSNDDGAAIALNVFGSMYLTGVTTSPDFPRVHPIQGQYSGAFNDAFVTKISPRLGL